MIFYREKEMKFLIKLFMLIASLFFAVVLLIKFVQGCTLKEAVGILEEFCIEMRENCPFASCGSGFSGETETEEESTSA